jgi:hypothetical protein
LLIQCEWRVVDINEASPGEDLPVTFKVGPEVGRVDVALDFVGPPPNKLLDLRPAEGLGLSRGIVTDDHLRRCEGAGRIAGTTLLDIIAGHGPATGLHLVPTRFAIREYCGCNAGAALISVNSRSGMRTHQLVW